MYLSLNAQFSIGEIKSPESLLSKTYKTCTFPQWKPIPWFQIDSSVLERLALLNILALSERLPCSATGKKASHLKSCWQDIVSFHSISIKTAFSEVQVSLSSCGSGYYFLPVGRGTIARFSARALCSSLLVTGWRHRTGTGRQVCSNTGSN